jgi:lipopolysaccharide export system ATP-binding protein
VKSYRRHRVVDEVDVEVRRGEVVGLLGPNGAGKTTTFYMMTGLVRPDRGLVSIDGEEVTDQPMYRHARKGVGYLPQETSIFRGLTVRDNLRAILNDRWRGALKSGWRSARRAEARRRGGSKAHTLSGGERRRGDRACPRELARVPAARRAVPGIDPIAVGDIQESSRDSPAWTRRAHHGP